MKMFQIYVKGICVGTDNTEFKCFSRKVYKHEPTSINYIYTPFSNSNSELGVRVFVVEPKSCFHAGDFVARRGAISSICRRPRQ